LNLYRTITKNTLDKAKNVEMSVGVKNTLAGNRLQARKFISAFSTGGNVISTSWPQSQTLHDNIKENCMSFQYVNYVDAANVAASTRVNEPVGLWHDSALLNAEVCQLFHHQGDTIWR